VAGQRQWNQVRPGQFYTCGRATDARAFCWGNNPRGELGDGTTTSRLRPTAQGVVLSLAQISAGYSGGCGVTTDGRAYCWGDNHIGQLGDGTTTRRLLPTPVLGPE
jgi:alpha-tubulin suppressor-like RCC1 family protein